MGAERALSAGPQHLPRRGEDRPAKSEVDWPPSPNISEELAARPAPSGGTCRSSTDDGARQAVSDGRTAPRSRSAFLKLAQRSAKDFGAVPPLGSRMSPGDDRAVVIGGRVRRGPARPQPPRRSRLRIRTCSSPVGGFVRGRSAPPRRSLAAGPHLRAGRAFFICAGCDLRQEASAPPSTRELTTYRPWAARGPGDHRQLEASARLLTAQGEARAPPGPTQIISR